MRFVKQREQAPWQTSASVRGRITAEMAVALGTAERREWSGPPPESVAWSKQASLPRLPVPDLGQTCVRYLRSVRPLLSNNEYEQTLAVVAAFAVGGRGEELQRRLITRRAEKHHSSWLAEWWNQRAYLTDREPVVFFVSYFYSFKRLSALPPSPPLLAGGRLQCAVAAAIVDAALTFKSKIDDGSLEPDMVGGAPQCMSAYPFLFNSCRIPASPADTVAVHHDPPASAHIIVARRGHFYSVATHASCGKRLSQQHLAAALLSVVSAADGAGDVNLSLGPLTGADRDTWAAARAILCESDTNKSALLTVEKAALMVCLDHQGPSEVGEEGAADRSRQMWHGDGVNRFYDKTLQFIVLPDGNAGFLGEHALADGAPTLRLCSELLPVARRALLASQTAVSHLTPSSSSVVELVWEGLDRLGGVIAEAKTNFDVEVAGHQTARVAVSALGSEAIKKLGVAPDPFCQLAMQLAFFRMHGRVPATYEACSTRRFLHGRTETIRSCSIESAAFARAMATSPQPKQAYDLVRQAAEQHRRYSAQCAQGMGIDRHLFGLKLSLRPGEDMPTIYSDKAFGLSSSWELSTSHLPSENFESWGFGEVAAEGFGTGYSCNKTESVFFVSCRALPSSKWPHRASTFACAIEQAMLDMANLCRLARTSSSKL